MQYTRLAMPNHAYFIVADQGKLAFVGSPDAPLSEAADYVSGSLEFNQEEMLPFKNAIDDYLTGKEQTITIPVTYHGTPLQEAVWQYLQTIPYGETRRTHRWQPQSVIRTPSKQSALRSGRIPL